MAYTLQELIDFVGKEVVFDATLYPDLAHTNEEEKYRFILKHSALHFAKTAGKIAAVSENADHGVAVDMAALKGEMVKSLINLLWLAEKTGTTADELIAGIEKKYDK